MASREPTWLTKRDAFMASLRAGRSYIRSGLIFPTDVPAILAELKDCGWELRRPKKRKQRK